MLLITFTFKPKKPTVAAAAAPAIKKAAPAASSAKAPAKASGAPTAGSLDTVKYKHTPEDAEALAAELIPGSIMADLGDANWKTRLAALEEMPTWLESQIDTLDAEVLVRALAKKGWSEKNFQVGSFANSWIYRLTYSLGFCQDIWHFNASRTTVSQLREVLHCDERLPSL